MKKSNRFQAKTPFLFLFLILLICSCSNDSLPENDEMEIETTRDWFQSNPTENDFQILKFATSVEWKSAYKYNLGNLEVVDVPVIIKENITLQSNNEIWVAKNKLFFIKNNESINSYFVHHTTTDFDLSELLHVLEDPTFSSMVTTDFFIVRGGQVPKINQDNFDKQSVSKEMTTESEPVICYEIVEIFDDGSREPTGISWCEDPNAGSTPPPSDGDTGGGGGGSGSPDNSAFLSQNVWDTSQSLDDWNKLTECEKSFFRSNPFTVFPLRQNKNLAKNAASQFVPNCDTHNTKLDAFRHAYFSALNFKSIGYVKAKALGDAHECETPLNRLNEKEMDLHNNAWGYEFARDFPNFTTQQFVSAFNWAVSIGKIKILKDCSSPDFIMPKPPIVD